MSKFNKFSSFSLTSEKILPKYTSEEVALHKTERDLWLIINDKIYDFSSYPKAHPGGAEIFYECAGNDATQVWLDSEHPAWADS
jgi:cytochrome b involved in lipid metabolism